MILALAGVAAAQGILHVQVHVRAAAAGAEVANHYLMKDVARQVAHGYYTDVAHLLRERGAPATVEAVPLLTQLALGLLRLPEAQRSKDAEAALKAVLLGVYNRLSVRSPLHLSTHAHVCSLLDTSE